MNYEIKIMYLLIFLFRNNTHSFLFHDQLLKYPVIYVRLEQNEVVFNTEELGFIFM